MTEEPIVMITGKERYGMSAFVLSEIKTKGDFHGRKKRQEEFE